MFTRVNIHVIYYIYIIVDLEEINKNDVFSDVIKLTISKLFWLIGNWQCISIELVGETENKIYTNYAEELQFSFTGQEHLNFYSRSWNSKTKSLMHYEYGFIHVNPDSNTEIAFVTSQSFGMTIIEEGTIQDQVLTLKSKNISCISFCKPPIISDLERTIELNGLGLLQISANIKINSKNSNWQQFLATYKKNPSIKPGCKFVNL